MPNMEDLSNRISTEISKTDDEELWITKIDLDYAYGQLELDEETKKQCVFALIGFLQIFERILRSSRTADNISRENRPNTKIQNTGVVG